MVGRLGSIAGVEFSGVKLKGMAGSERAAMGGGVSGSSSGQLFTTPKITRDLQVVKMATDYGMYLKSHTLERFYSDDHVGRIVQFDLNRCDGIGHGKILLSAGETLEWENSGGIDDVKYRVIYRQARKHPVTYSICINEPGIHTAVYKAGYAIWTEDKIKDFNEEPANSALMPTADYVRGMATPHNLGIIYELEILLGKALRKAKKQQASEAVSSIQRLIDLTVLREITARTIIG